jgi:DNA repair protein RadC
MKKRPILNAYETKIFNEWIADGNAVEQTKGVWVEQSTQYRKKFTYEELQKFFKKEYLSYRTGGKIGFDALAKKVAKRYAGEKVEPQYQAEYGKKYSKSEAEEVGRKVAGKVYWQQQGRKFNGGGGVETVKKDRYGNEVRIGDAIRIKVLTGRYGQTKIYEGVVTNFGLFGKVELDGQRELSYTANYIHNDYEHGHHIWVEKINENDINENLRVPKKFVPSYSGTINGEKFGISGNEKFKEWLNENYPNSIFDSWYNLYNKGWRVINNEYVSPEKVPYTEVRVYESAETGQGFLYSLMIPKEAKFNGGGGVDDSEINKILEELEKHYLFGSRGLNLITDIEQVQNPQNTTYYETIARKDFFETQLYEWLKKYDIVGGFNIIWVGDLEKINNWKTKIKELKSNGYLVVTKISAPTKDRTKHFRYIAIKQKFNNGGSVPNLNKMFHLPIEMAVYVPSTQDVNNVISVDEMEKRVREVKEYLANKFGGYTSAEKMGGFVDSQAELVNEEVVQITAFSTKEAYEENKEALVQKLSDWAKEWGQEAIGFEYEGDLMYVPQKFVGGGKAIRQTQFAVYKLLDKEGLVKYFTDTDLEKFLQEWNEDYNTDYEDFVEFNEYEREFIIKPVFSKNDMGGTASQPSFLEIQINDVPNWENEELANYLDAPISLVAKNRNFYVKEVQNEMMLNVIPNYAGGGSAKKSMENSPLKEYYEKYTNGGFVGGDVIKFKYDGKDFTRKVESVDEMGNAVVNIMKTQKATINPTDIFEIKKEKDDKSIIIEKIGLNEENANFLIGLSPTFAVWLADSIVELTTKSNLYGSRDETIKALNESPNLVTQFRERIRGILDWLQHPSTPKQNLRELTFGEAERKAKEWHNELTTSGGDLNFIEPIENTVLVTYPPNEFGKTYYWVFIPKNYCDIESSRMGHCGRTGAGSLISLRSVFKNTNEDTITDSHVTIAYNKDDGLFYQAKGKQNRKPIEKYFPYIFDLIKMMASGQVTENFKLTQKEKIKELQGQKIELEKEVNKLQKYFESREAIEEDTNVLVDKAIIFQTEKKKLENINSQIEKLNEESSFDFNGFGSEYQSSNDYGYEDMTNEQVKELYAIKPDMFNDFAGQFMLYEAGLIDEKPNTTIVIEKSPEYVADLLRLDRDLSEEVVEKVLTGETYDWFSGSDSWGYYYENAGDYVDDLYEANYEAVIDKIVELTGLDKSEVKENGAKHYLNGDDEDFDKDNFDDIKRAIASAMTNAEENAYVKYYYEQIESALSELGTIKKLNYDGVEIEIDLENLMSISAISSFLKNLDTDSLEDVFFEAESQGEIELPELSIDDRYSAYPDDEDFNANFDINNYEEGGVIYQDLSKIKPMVVNDKTVLTEFELKKSKSSIEIETQIRSSDDVVNILRQIWEKDTINAYEQAYVLFLNTNNKVIGYYHHSSGGISGTIMEVQMISGMAVKSLAKGVIIAHNHPSGNRTPSDADEKITKQLSEALKLFNIKLLDSIILTERSYLSFADEGILK